MKATIVLIADDAAENFGRKLMLEAHKLGKMGFEMARLPQHVSLKQPFSISNLEDVETLFDEFVKELCPFDIEFEQIDLFPSNVLGGVESGCMSLRAKKTNQLVEAQKTLNKKLLETFGPCPADHDDDYVFHMTFAIGGASFESYQIAYEELAKNEYNQTFRFNKVGLLYYDDDNITPGTYFCYKISHL